MISKQPSGKQRPKRKRHWRRHEQIQMPISLVSICYVFKFFLYFVFVVNYKGKIRLHWFCLSPYSLSLLCACILCISWYVILQRFRGPQPWRSSLGPWRHTQQRLVTTESGANTDGARAGTQGSTGTRRADSSAGGKETWDNFYVL